MVVGVGLCIGVIDFGADRQRQFWKGESLGRSIVTKGLSA